MMAYNGGYPMHMGKPYEYGMYDDKVGKWSDIGHVFYPSREFVVNLFSSKWFAQTVQLKSQTDTLAVVTSPFFQVNN
jgi:hypothetical protein